MGSFFLFDFLYLKIDVFCSCDWCFEVSTLITLDSLNKPRAGTILSFFSMQPMKN